MDSRRNKENVKREMREIEGEDQEKGKGGEITQQNGEGSMK